MMKFFKNEKAVDKVPENFTCKCRKCEATNFTSVLKENYFICSECGFNLPRTSRQVIEQVVDGGSFHEVNIIDKVVNPVGTEGYEEKISGLKESLDVDESVITGTAKVEGITVAIGVMDTRFLMGSLGSVTGEKITRLFEYATRKKVPVVLFTASGGARMQEGIVSLMQMSKVTLAIKQHHNAGLFYMPVLMNPTTGGVSASFAQLGDIIIAEEKALICFAGPKVIEKTINQKLPEGFQTAEFLLEKGFLDRVVKRSEERTFIAKMLRFHEVK